jgi:hypothetical protein
VNGEGWSIGFAMAPGTAIPRHVSLEPGETLLMPVRFQISPGEFELLAGFSRDYRTAERLVSNQVPFAVDKEGRAHLADGATRFAHRPARRTTTVCGTLTLEDGRPASGARAFLWLAPMPKEDARAMSTTLAGSDGRFRMEAVPEGKYVLSGLYGDSRGVFLGALGAPRPKEAAPLNVGDTVEGCPYFLTLSRQPGFTYRGRTTPDTSGEHRKAHLQMIGGDAFAFETTTEIHADGGYEFRNVPPGECKISVGANFWTSRIAGNREYPFTTQWPVPVGEPSSPEWVKFKEETARWQMKLVRDAQATYAKHYGHGLAATLKPLAHPPEWYHTTDQSAGILGVKTDEQGLEFVHDGYRITYIPALPDSDGKITSCTVTARPVEFGKTVSRSFLMDENGKIHATTENRPAALQDPVVKQ